MAVHFPHLYFTTAVPPRNAVPHTVIAHESALADLPRLELVLCPALRSWQRSKHFIGQTVDGSFTRCAVNAAVLFVTPLPGLAVQITEIRELSSWHEVLLDELNASFDFAFGLWTSYAADLRDHADGCGEVFKQRMPARLSVVAHAQDDGFHLVGEHRFRDAAKVLQGIHQAA